MPELSYSSYKLLFCSLEGAVSLLGKLIQVAEEEKKRGMLVVAGPGGESLEILLQQ